MAFEELMFAAFTLAGLRSHTFLDLVEASLTQGQSDSGWTLTCPTSMSEHVRVGSSMVKYHCSCCPSSFSKTSGRDIKKLTYKGQRGMFCTC